MEDMLQEDLGEEKNWSRKKILGLGAFLVVGIIIVGFGLWQFSYRIKAPFLGKGGGLKTFKSLDQKELEKMVEKQKKDTDNDGLTDFDEEYVYKTSAYLDDSDSDGFLDKVEIDTGNDPNCPSGKDCGIAIAGGGDTSSEIVLPSAEEFLSGGATPEMIREALRKSGASEEMLASVDDQTLLDAYAEVVKETGGGDNLEEAVAKAKEEEKVAEEEPEAEKGQTKTITTEADFANLTPAEIRQLLLESGMDEATLNSIDDETLLEVLQEALKEVKN